MRAKPDHFPVLVDASSFLALVAVAAVSRPVVGRPSQRLQLVVIARVSTQCDPESIVSPLFFTPIQDFKIDAGVVVGIDQITVASIRRIQKHTHRDPCVNGAARSYAPLPIAADDLAGVSS